MKSIFDNKVGGRRMDKNTLKILLSEYKNGKTMTFLSKTLGFDRSVIRYWLKKEGIELRDRDAYHKYSYDKSYFEKIDSPEKAYFLGFIMADGCISNKSLIINIQERDRKILDLFKESIRYTGEIQFIKRARPTWQDQVKIQIHDLDLVKQLENLGIFERKSLNLRFPNYITSDLINHFIRGYFDGDGSVGIYDNKRKVKNKIYLYRLLSFNIISTLEFSNSLKTILEDLGINVCLSPHVNKKMWYIKVCSKNGNKIFYDFIYKDCKDFYLNRKKAKFEESIT